MKGIEIIAIMVQQIRSGNSNEINKMLKFRDKYTAKIFRNQNLQKLDQI